MGELIQLRGGQEENKTLHIENVVNGVFILNTPPSEELLETGEYITISQFGEASEAIGETVRIGHQAMCSIATEMVGLELGRITNDGTSWRIPPWTPEQAVLSKVRGMFQNPLRVNKGSKNLILLGHQLVFDTWAAGEGSELIRSKRVPKLRPAEHRVVSAVVERTR
jgi:hypothetical protein